MKLLFFLLVFLLVAVEGILADKNLKKIIKRRNRQNILSGEKRDIYNAFPEVERNAFWSKVERTVGRRCWKNSNCASGNCVNKKCRRPLNRPVGNYCESDSQCASGNCGESDTFMRETSSMVRLAGRSKVRSVDKTCQEAVDRPVGNYCESDSQCASLNCGESDTSSMVGVAGRSKVRSVDKTCQEAIDRPVGIYCESDSQCASGNCGESDTSSMVGVAGRSKVRSVDKTCQEAVDFPVGNYCESDSQCASGNCGESDTTDTPTAASVIPTTAPATDAPTAFSATPTLSPTSANFTSMVRLAGRSKVREVDKTCQEAV